MNRTVRAIGRGYYLMFCYALVISVILASATFIITAGYLILVLLGWKTVVALGIIFGSLAFAWAHGEGRIAQEEYEEKMFNMMGENHADDSHTQE